MDDDRMIGEMKKVRGNGTPEKTHAHGACPPQSSHGRPKIEPTTPKR